MNRIRILLKVPDHEIELHMPKHVDQEIEGFRLRDLEKLVKQTIADLDKIHQQEEMEFKEHEMQKELERRRELEVNSLF